MIITSLKQELRKYLSSWEIDKKVKIIRAKRKWNSKYFENKYVERRLFDILQTYKSK